MSTLKTEDVVIGNRVEVGSKMFEQVKFIGEVVEIIPPNTKLNSKFFEYFNDDPESIKAIIHKLDEEHKASPKLILKLAKGNFFCPVVERLHNLRLVEA